MQHVSEASTAVSPIDSDILKKTPLASRDSEVHYRQLMCRDQAIAAVVSENFVARKGLDREVYSRPERGLFYAVERTFLWQSPACTSTTKVFYGKLCVCMDEGGVSDDFTLLDSKGYIMWRVSFMLDRSSSSFSLSLFSNYG